MRIYDIVGLIVMILCFIVGVFVTLFLFIKRSKEVLNDEKYFKKKKN